MDVEGRESGGIGGGEEVGYEGRKKGKRRNGVYVRERKGVGVGMWVGKRGEDDERENIVGVMEKMMEEMGKGKMRREGVLVNGDGGFDCGGVGWVVKSYGIV